MTSSLQYSMNKWTNEQMNAINASNDSIYLNHYFIDYSLNIEHCSLIIASEGGL